MEKLPLFISVGAFLIWGLVALLMTKKLCGAARGIGLGLSLVQLGSAIWGAVRIFSGTSGVQWSGTWFSLSPQATFEIKLLIDPVAMVFWLALSVFAAVSAYFALLSQLNGSRSQARGEAVAVPLLGIAALLTISSGNFISYCFGWALVPALGFLAVSFSAPTRDDRAAASFRYIILNTIPEVLFVAGILGCYMGFGTLGFSEINDRAAGNPGQAWAILCLVAGTMLRNLQMPLMQSARYLASARSSATPIFFLGHALLSSVLFAKLYPAILATEGIHYFAIVPAFTAIASAVLALPERDPPMLVGWFVSYLCASVFLSGLLGNYQASQALALTGSIGVFLLATTLNELGEDDPSARWFSGIAMLTMAGLPITGWGWARYLEYAGFIHSEQATSFHWIVFGMKILADLLMSIVLLAIVRDRWNARREAPRVRWDVVVPLVVLSIACLAAATGGRPFGGILGRADLDAFPGIAWFERLVIEPLAAGGKPIATAVDFIGSDADIFARFIGTAVFVLPLLVGGILFFREEESLGQFRELCSRMVGKLGLAPNQDTKLWSWLIRPMTHWVGQAAALFDRKALDYLMADVWLRPARAVRRVFWFIEKSVLDRCFIDGTGAVVATIGKSLRLVQNGQVQFYFALGLILMGAVVVKFVFVGG